MQLNSDQMLRMTISHVRKWEIRPKIPAHSAYAPIRKFTATAFSKCFYLLAHDNAICFLSVAKGAGGARALRGKV